MNADWNMVLSGLGGAVIGGAATIAAQIYSAHVQRKREETAEANMIRGFTQAIADEVASVWERYSLEIGPHLKDLPEDQAARVFPLHQSYFVVFDSSASLIGRIPDNKLREQIIATYIEAKGFVDSMRYYERLVDAYNEQKELPVQTSGPVQTGGSMESAGASISNQIGASVANLHRLKKLHRTLVDYSKQLKLAHSRLETKVENLKGLLQTFLS